MAINHTYAEQTDMLMVLGYCEENCRRSVRVYNERFLNRRVPNHKTFANIVRRLRETGKFAPITANRGRARTIRTPRVEDEILEIVEENPEVSSRCLALQAGVSKDAAHRVLKEQLLHPYHVQNVQELLPAHTIARLEFCMFIQERRAEDFPNKWIGREADAPVKWAPRSPDINICDSFLWEL
ncbi:hypothetical protein CBL_10017 [Carabus blaptoides fortunei]